MSDVIKRRLTRSEPKSPEYEQWTPRQTEWSMTELAEAHLLQAKQWLDWTLDRWRLELGLAEETGWHDAKGRLVLCACAVSEFTHWHAIKDVQR